VAKQSGLGDQLFVGGVDIGADVAAINNLSTPRETLPGTNITQSAMARLFGKRDGVAEFSCFFNDATGETHDALSALPRTDTQVMYLRGEGLGNAALAMNAKQINYDGNRADDGSFMFTVSTQANAYGADWGDQVTVGRQVDASGTTGTGVDLGKGTAGSKAFGFQAYLHVFSLGSGTASIKLQGSSDNGGSDAYADITDGDFTDVTAAGFERIQSASDTLSVERYVRVVTSGTFTDLDFCVMFVRNEGTRAI
jgi:hypothetical protein